MDQDITPGAERPKDSFTLSHAISGHTETFQDAREAGAAFAAADPSDRPLVIHSDGSFARPMARTEIHGAHDNGQPRYFKSLPDSHEVDAEFRAGFVGALEKSLGERMQAAERDQTTAAPDTRDGVSLTPQLQNDLEMLSRHAPEAAVRLMADHGYQTETGGNGPEREEAQIQPARDTSDGDFARNPRAALSTWVAQTDKAISAQPDAAQPELRKEMYGLAAEAADAFGLDREKARYSEPPRSTLYCTNLRAGTLSLAGAETELSPERQNQLREGLSSAAADAGLDPKKLLNRMTRGGANADEEAAWVKSDLTDVAARHKLELDKDDGRAEAAGIVDRFYQKAADLLHEARAPEKNIDRDHLVGALDALAKVNHIRGSVAFKSEDQARDFAEDMKATYGPNVLRDMAEGRTDALARDVPSSEARAAMAQAVVAAAREHPGLGLTANEIETADHRTAVNHQADTHAHSAQASRPRQFVTAHAQDREL